MNGFEAILRIRKSGDAGARVPIVLTSRGASAREKEVSILLAAASAAAR